MDTLTAETVPFTPADLSECGDAPPVWEQRSIDAAHSRVHRLIGDVIACWYASTGCPPGRLCGPNTPTPMHPFAGVSSAEAAVSAEAWDGPVPGESAFAARVPVMCAGRMIGHVFVSTRSAPDLDVLARIAAPEVERGGGGRSDVVRAEDPLHSLGDEEQEALLELFEAEPGSQPTVHCLLQRVARALGRPVVVQTSRFVLIESVGQADGVVLDPANHRDQDAAALAARSVGPVLVPGRGDQTSRAIVKIRADRGQPHLLVAEVAPDDTWSLAILRQAAGILSWVLRMVRDSHDDVAVRRAALVADIVRGHDLTGVTARAAVLGHDLNTPHRTFAFLLADQPDEHALPRAEQIVVEAFRRGTVGPEALVSGAGRYVVALVPEDGRSAPELSARQCLAAARRDGVGLVCGVGPIGRGPETLSGGVHQAQRAAEVLRHTGRTDSVVSYEDLGILGFLFSESDRGRIDAFVERWLGPLVDHDTHSNADLVHTVEAILDHPTMMAAANSLYIHISTLKYRCKRIEEILAVDMRDPEVTFNLRLAMKLSAIRDGLSEGRS